MTTLDWIALTGFLLLTLIVGTYAARNVSGMKAFAVGNRSYGTMALFATLSASYIGGGYTFGISEKVFTSGIVQAFCLLGFSLQQILVALFLAPRMAKFNDAYSIGDIMAKLYGKSGRFVTAIASIAVCAGITGAQVNATGYVFNLFLGIDHMVGVLIGCGIVIAYAAYGGMKAVVATDILQFAVLIIAIPLVLVFGYLHLQDPTIATQALPETHLNLPGSVPLLTIASLFLSLLIGEALVPPYVQRLFIAKNEKVTAKGTLLSGMLSVPFFLTAGSIGLIALALDPNLNANMSLPYVIQEVLPTGLKGLAIAGIIAVVMSSADSFLNAAAIAVVHDLIKPNFAQSMSGKTELRLSRISTVVIGLLSVAFALSIENVIDILLYSYNFWAPVILVPFAMGLLGKTLCPKGFLISAFSGVCAVVIWNTFYQDTGFDGLVIGVAANLITFTTLYTLQKKPATA